MRSDLLVVFSFYRVFLRDRPNGKFVVFHTLICVILKTEYVLGGVFWKSFGDRTVFWYFCITVCRVVGGRGDKLPVAKLRNGVDL